ncbi:unnamed protein product [Boreogadus saida]
MLPCRAWGCGRLSSVPNDRHQHMGVRSDTVSSLDQPPGCSSIQNVPVSIKAVWKLTLLPDEAKALPLSGRWFTWVLHRLQCYVIKALGIFPRHGQ